MSEDLEDTGSVFDLNEVPETELLDNSIQKGRAQLSIKARRPRPSMSRYRDSVSSTEGDDSMETKVGLMVRHSPVDKGASLAALPRGRYHQLTNATSQEPLVTPSSSPSRYRPSSDCSRVYMRRSRRPDSEVLVSDSSRDTSPADPDSPTVVFDKKTKRCFLDIGVTLRRSYIRVRKDKSNRLSVGSRETSESPPRSSGSFVPFSWFTEGRGSASSFRTPPPSPKVSTTTRGLTPPRSHSQESALSEEFSPPPDSSSSCPPVDSSSSSRSSHPYHTLSQSSDEAFEDSSCPVSSWTTQQVCHWLRGLNMERYVQEFSARDIDGKELLQMDGNKLKAVGVVSSSDRSTLKRCIKDFQSVVEKERKVLRQKEKQRRDNEHRRN
ncbi:sterile alpha motif domain-containing protein 14 isoform X1 [Gasterosteus aculeatus]